jgi:hypothetical protein
MTNFKGTTGDDTLVGTSGNDAFNVTQGGNDTVSGGDGNDVINFGASLTAADTIDGGTGSDRVILSGDYSSTLTLSDSTMVNVEEIILRTGNSYALATADGNIAAGQSLTINGVALGAADSLTFNGGAETDGRLHVIGGAGDDRLIGGARSDVFDISHGGEDSIQGYLGNDIIRAGAKGLDAGDVLRGGAGNDALELTSGQTVVLGPTTLLSIERVLLSGAAAETLTLDAATVASANGAMTFDASAMAGRFILNAAAKDAGVIDVIGGGGNDIVNFGAGFAASDSVDGGGQNDAVHLNGDYSAGLNFSSASPFTGVGTLYLDGGFTYDLSLGASAISIINGAAAAQIDIDGSQLTGLTRVVGSAGADTFTTNSLATAFSGGDGDDTLIVAGDAAAGTARLDGGAGMDTLVLGTAVDQTDLHNFEAIDVNPGIGTFSIDIDGKLQAAGNDIETVDGHLLGATDSLQVRGNDGRGITLGIGGEGNDILAGWRGATLTGGGGADQLGASIHYDGGGEFDYYGHDTFIYNAVTDSTSTAYDTIEEWYSVTDVFKLWFAVTGVDTEVVGTPSQQNFDSDLATLVGPSQLAPHHAVMVSPRAGIFNSEGFIVVDANGVAGYQAGQDLVIHVTDTWDVNLTTADFTS